MGSQERRYLRGYVSPSETEPLGLNVRYLGGEGMNSAES